MDVSEAVATRRSVRAFLADQVDRGVLLRVLDEARRAPSGGNVQPCHAAVLAGEPLKRLVATVAAKIGERRGAVCGDGDRARRPPIAAAARDA